MNVYAMRLQQLRELMKEEGINAYLIPSADPHLCEYLPDYWKSRVWISGFTGSMGNVLVTQDYAALWADGRYWIQAERELEGSGIELQKLSAQNTLSGWLKTHLKDKEVLGVDGKVLPYAFFDELKSHLDGCGAKIETQKDLIAKLWTKDRPAIPSNPVFEHPLEFSITPVGEKIEAIREEMKKVGATYHLLSSLEDIAWVTNLRGGDIAYNPIFLAYMLIGEKQSTLFVDQSKISVEIKRELEKDSVILKDYETLFGELCALREERLLVDPSKTTVAVLESLNNSVDVVYAINPSVHLKARKNPQEIAHIRNAMKQDGAALCHFFAWLEEQKKSGARLSELDIAKKLTETRAKQPYYHGDSFNTIAGFNANGAQPHYSATQESFAYLEGNGFLLLDSGAHYLNGTTDITRVVPFGEVSDEQKRDYTLVLKACIAMNNAVFPRGIPMPMLDSITRVPLWKEGLDYVHGTGHGVGYFLNVHEGPQVLSYYVSPEEKTRSYEGMIISIEPGIYKKGQWGVRLENLVALQPHSKDFLCFETLTLCPYEISCIVVELLTQEEKEWVNAYHQKVLEALSPLLQDDTKALQWLLERTRPL